MTLPKGCPTTFVKTYPGLTVLDKARRRDDGEERGKHHTSVPIARQLEAEPYTSGSTTTQGSTSDARIDNGVDAEGGLDEYPRRRRPRDNQSVGKRLDLHIHGKGARQKVVNALKRSFPGKDWDSIGKHVVITGKDCHRRVMECISALGGKMDVK
jgi:hypothetical protein